MQYEKSSKGLITVRLEDQEEVETVQSAFVEHNDYLRSLGNHSSISTLQKVIEGWTTVPQKYLGKNIDPVVTKLLYFAETTEERVDEILDRPYDDPTRIPDTARRYRLGCSAVRLLENIEDYATV